MTKKDALVKYYGPVDTTRCSAYPDLECVLFLFQEVGVAYDSARQALLKHYEKEQHGRYEGTSYPFDAMRRLSLNPVSTTYLPLVVEAHFVEPQKRRELLTTAMENDGFISIMWNTEDNAQQKIKVLSTIPKRPKYSVYKVSDIPLGPPSRVREDFRRAIGRALKGRKEDDEDDDEMDIDLCRTLVDIVIGYEMNDDGLHPLYDGSFTVVLDTTYLSFEKEFSFSLYGGVYTLNEPTRHFLYCRKCKALDSHVTYEVDCSSRKHTRNQ